jgi:DNA-binding CsgD family transcriptional regulator
MLENLTDREKKVFALLCRNKTNFKIALEIGMSEPTVRLDLRKIYAKLGFESHDPTEAHALRRRVMLYAKEHGAVVQDDEDREGLAAYTVEDIKRAAREIFPDQRIRVVNELINFLEIGK